MVHNERRGWTGWEYVLGVARTGITSLLDGWVAMNWVDAVAAREKRYLSGVGQFGTPSEIGNHDQRGGHGEVERHAGGVRRCAEEIEAGIVMRGSDVPPDGIDGFEDFAGAAPDAEGQS